MSTHKEKFEAIKAFFFGEPVAPVVPVAPALAAPPVDPAPPAMPAATIYKSKDGKEVSVTQAGDIPATGDAVMVDGIPAPAGDIELEDGSMISVDEMGTITVFTPAASAAASAPVTPEAPTAPAPPSLEERLAVLEAEIMKMRQPVTQMASEELKAASDKIEKHSKTIEGLFSLVEKMTELPTADPKTLTGNKKDRFERVNKKEQELEEFAAALKKLKNK